MKILVFSDSHIGEYSEGWADPETKLNTRLLDTLQVWTWIIDLAEKEDVNAVVFAGDRFRLRRPPYWLLHLADAKIKDMCNLGIPLFLLVGNHDQYDKAGTWDSFNGLRIWDDKLVHIVNQPAIHRLGNDVDLHFVPYGFREEEYFTPDDPDSTNLLFFHDDVEGVSNYGSSIAQNGIPKEWLDKAEWDLVLGGHVHLHQELPLETTNGFHIGSPLDLAQDGPQGAKGAWILTLSDDPKSINIDCFESPAPKIMKHRLEAIDGEVDLSELENVKGNILQLQIEGEGGGRLRKTVLQALREAGARSAQVTVAPRVRQLTENTESVINAKLPLSEQVMEWAKEKTEDQDTLWHLQQILSEES